MRLKKWQIDYIVKWVLLIVFLTVNIFLIWTNGKGYLIFISGYLSGVFTLMVLRTWLYNTHKLIKEQRAKNG